MKKSVLVPRRYGFTLLELSVVLLIIAVIIGMSATMGNSMIASARRSATNNKLDQIEKSLMAFRMANNRLPCPSDVALPDNSIYFGTEALNAGACTTGSSYNGNGIRTSAASPGPTANVLDYANNAVEGGIPFKALNLPKEFAYDSWGRRIAYAVNYNVTGISAMLHQTMAERCNITVNNAASAPRTSAALYALVSYGPDGHGGYLSTGVRNNAGATNTNELLNCHCTSTATQNPYSASYAMQDHSEDPQHASNNFDDFVRYKERWQMQNYDDDNNGGGPVCNPGFRMDSYVPGGYLGNTAIGDINGDGIPDMAVSTYFGVYVIFGTKYGFPDPLPLNSLNGSNGFFISWENVRAVAFGNITGHKDSTKDLVISTSGDGTGNNNLYVLFGHNGSWASSYTVAGNGQTSSNPSQGITITVSNGSNNFWLAAGNVSGHGDGVEDLIFGQAGQNGTNGQVSVLFGQEQPWTGNFTINPSYMNGANGVTYTGSNQNFGSFVATGDYNGDGIKDIFILDGGPNQVDVVFGRKTGWPTSPTPIANIVNNSTNNGYDGFYLQAQNPIAALATGDINGDGFSDIVAGGSSMSLIFGKPCGIGSANGSPNCAPNPVYMSSLNGLSGTVANGVSTVNGINGVNGVNFNTSASPGALGMQLAVGDTNGDGFADILAGLYFSGNVFVMQFGHGTTTAGNATPWPSTIELDSGSSYFDGKNGIEIDGIYANNFGSIANIGDINGDGLGDILLLNAYDTYGGAGTGSAYVLYGRRKWWKSPLDVSQGLDAYHCVGGSCF